MEESVIEPRLDALDAETRATLGSPGGWPGLLERFAAAAQRR